MKIINNFINIINFMTNRIFKYINDKIVIIQIKNMMKQLIINNSITWSQYIVWLNQKINSTEVSIFKKEEIIKNIISDTKILYIKFNKK